ncbi:TIGR01777 family oxidoreductase [Microscilla marina]|uniref:TIGR01777 family protein n=1 Tax=Microscilla marina ATCC 23134 TaxID=313606 RepID=A1ZN59_MICM2|nr:TIGR01777 family oxidoreductase [Microscilla marina]EAY28240.1 conserved hypothetical protein [Microscilla marina ATCC 23134]
MNKQRKIVIPGGTGFIGQVMARHFVAQGDEVIILTRKKSTQKDGVQYVQWDGKNLDSWATTFEGADAVINMAGRTVNCRYNKKNKQQIYDSRLFSTEVIGVAIAQCEHPPALWINAGSATIYRHALDRPMDEATGEFGSGFSVDVCQKWEATFDKMKTPHTRKLMLRIAMVLGREGGVIPPFMNLVKRGLGGTQGKGNQFISWIHEYDFVRIIEWLMAHKEVTGVLNVSSPHPEPNQKFMKTLRQVMNVSFGLPATQWMLEIGAWFIGTETELIVKSRQVVPGRLQALGFTLKYPYLKEAFEEIIHGQRSPQTTQEIVNS